MIFLGSVAYGVVTGLVVELLVVLAGRRSAQELGLTTSVK